MAEVESGSQRLSNQFSSNNCLLLLFLLSIVVVIAAENSFWPSLLKHTHAWLCNGDKCNILAVTISLYRCDTC